MASKKDKSSKVDMHPASRIFLGLIGAFNVYISIIELSKRIKLEVQGRRMIKLNERYFRKFEEYDAWSKEFHQVIKRMPRPIKPLVRRLP